jgi:hypothetical protein
LTRRANQGHGCIFPQFVKRLLANQRCGAKIRAGGSCRSPAMRGKQRCRKHGVVSKVAERKQIQAMVGDVRKLLREMK